MKLSPFYHVWSSVLANMARVKSTLLGYRKMVAWACPQLRYTCIALSHLCSGRWSFNASLYTKKVWISFWLGRFLAHTGVELACYYSYEILTLGKKKPKPFFFKSTHFPLLVTLGGYKVLWSLTLMLIALQLWLMTGIVLELQETLREDTTGT